MIFIELIILVLIVALVAFLIRSGKPPRGPG